MGLNKYNFSSNFGFHDHYESPTLVVIELDCMKTKTNTTEMYQKCTRIYQKVCIFLYEVEQVSSTYH